MKTVVLHLLTTVVISFVVTLLHRLPHPPPFEWGEYLVRSIGLSLAILALSFLLSLFNKLSQRKYLFLQMVRHILTIMVVVVILGDWIVPLIQVFDSYDLYFYVELVLSILVLYWIFDSTAGLMFPRVKRPMIHLVSSLVILFILFLEFRQQLLPSSLTYEEMPETMALIEPILPFNFATTTPDEYLQSLKKNAEELQENIEQDIQDSVKAE